MPLHKNTLIKLGLLGFVIVLVSTFYAYGLQQYFSLEAIKNQQQLLTQTLVEHPLLTTSIFFGLYVIITALSLPAAALLTLLAGALFGFWVGLVVVSFASTIGATLAFLMARFILRDTLQNKYGAHLKTLNDGFAKEGAFYLFALRLVPVFPFFLVNLTMGLLPISTRTFFMVSQLGMLPGTAVYVYAGTALASLTSLAGILSPPLLIAFVLLGLLPIVAKKIIAFLRKNNHAV
jgi:uncharacterized membrane protein YdjX (TVP38/TMEM64 family)